MLAASLRRFSSAQSGLQFFKLDYVYVQDAYYKRSKLAGLLDHGFSSSQGKARETY
jgi:hypothetical protein